MDANDGTNREKLRDQNALSEEIVAAITSNALGETVDEDELEKELEYLQQEQLDEQMLGTGPVPVADAVHKMPAVANGKSTCWPLVILGHSDPDFILGIKEADTPNQQFPTRRSKRTTRRRNSGNSRQKWPCNDKNFLHVRAWKGRKLIET